MKVVRLSGLVVAGHRWQDSSLLSGLAGAAAEVPEDSLLVCSS